MSQSELAFLALGLILGAAGGAALLVMVGSRGPRREIRVTVTRDAVPRRSPTLALDAFVTSPAETAPGGPGDRRRLDRGAPGSPVPASPVAVGPGRSDAPSRRASRTPVPSPSPMTRPSTMPAPNPIASASATAVAIAAEPRPGPVWPAESTAPAPIPAVLRIIRGDHGAMLRIVDRLAGSDGRLRRDWEVLLAGLEAAIAETATDEGVLDFPMGTPFWDSFTVEQCRQLMASLASMGHRFDGRDGWADGRVPTYRELGQALADVGQDPRRVRVWPNSTEIAQLLRGVRPAADDLLVRDAPTLELEAVRELTRWHGDTLTGLWLNWDSVRPLLLAVDAEEPAPD